MDPEELVVCPYDPVHRVAAKKLPYHISKCRKQYDKYGEYKTCPFNARHIVPAPEFQYHMEMCDDKGAIDMEIAFEQSKHEVSNTAKGCTDIPPMPNWKKPKETENWDEDAAPVLRPQFVSHTPPVNLHRPTPSKPVTRFDSPRSPYTLRKSPIRYSSPSHSPRPPLHRPVASYQEEDLKPKSRSTPEVENDPLINHDEFPLLSSHQTTSNSPHNSLNQEKQNVSNPLQTQPQKSYQQSVSGHLSQTTVTSQPTFPPAQYPHHQQQPIYCSQQQFSTIPHLTQTQPIHYTNPAPVTIPSQSFQPTYPPQPVYYNVPVNNQVHYMPPSTYYAQQPQPQQYYPMQPTDPYYPPQHSYTPQPQPGYPYPYVPHPISQMPLQRSNGPIFPPEQQPYIPMNPPLNQQIYANVPTGVTPPVQYESSVGPPVNSGRGRGRGLFAGSPPKKDYPSGQLLLQMEELQLTQLNSQYTSDVSQSQTHQNDVSISPQTVPPDARAPSSSNHVKISLARIALIEHKQKLGTPLSKEDEELLASKDSLLEKLK